MNGSSLSTAAGLVAMKTAVCVAPAIIAVAVNSIPLAVEATRGVLLSESESPPHPASVTATTSAAIVIFERRIIFAPVNRRVIACIYSST
jgi:hypothetical protein